MGSSPYAMQAKGFEKWTNATDAYGFSALPAGLFAPGSSIIVGSNAYFWSATEDDSGNAYRWNLNAGGAGLHNNVKDFGFAVRCIKDPN